MTYAKFASLVRNYTKTNSTTLGDTELLLLANAGKDELAGQIIEKNEDLFLMPFYRDLEADTREYAMPDEQMQIKYVEAMLDGENLEHLVETDMNSLGFPMDETNIRLNFADRKPAYDIVRRALYILNGDAIAAVTNGLKLRAIIYPADFTDLSLTTDMAVDPSTTTFGWPRPFHELLARLVAITWKGSRPKPVPLSPRELRYDIDLEKALATLGQGNLDRTTTVSAPESDGSEY